MRKLTLIVLAVTLGGSVLLSGGLAGAQTGTTQAETGQSGTGGATTTTAGAGVGVRGVIKNGQDPVEGVTITVKDASGQVVGEATTDAEGVYDIPLPEPGDYSATLDPATLPDGVDLRNPDRATLEFTLFPSQTRPLLYPLGEAENKPVSELRKFAQLLVEGIKFGLVIAMGAIGLSLILNAELRAARPIEVSFLPRSTAVEDEDLIRTKVNMIPESVNEIRVVDIVGLDKQADGGTHVASTDEVGTLRVVKTESKGKGNKRLRIEIDDA